IQRGLEELGSSRSVDGLEICNMLWFVITDKETDQTPQGKGSNLLAGTVAQITDKLKRYKEAGLTMPLLWPALPNVPVAKTLDDLKRLREGSCRRLTPRSSGSAKTRRNERRGTGCQILGRSRVSADPLKARADRSEGHPR